MYKLSLPLHEKQSTIFNKSYSQFLYIWVCVCIIYNKLCAVQVFFIQHINQFSCMELSFFRPAKHHHAVFVFIHLRYFYTYLFRFSFGIVFLFSINFYYCFLVASCLHIWMNSCDDIILQICKRISITKFIKVEEKSCGNATTGDSSCHGMIWARTCVYAILFEYPSCAISYQYSCYNNINTEIIKKKYRCFSKIFLLFSKTFLI